MAVMIPILPSSDFDRTAGFYGLLGFDERGRWPGEYLILADPEGMEVHFWASPPTDPATSTSSCYARVASSAAAEAIHARWSTLPLPPGTRVTTPVETDYGLVEFGVIDPDGNLIRVGGPTPPER